VLIAIVAPAVASAIANPAASWNFDEPSGQVAVDGVGSLDGGVTGATRIADGVSGGALRFDGGDRVTIPDNPVLRTADISVSLWVRGDPDAPPADGSVILERGGEACNGGAYALIVDGAHVALRFRDAEVGDMRTLHVGPNAAFPTLWDGQWHQVGFLSHTDTFGSAAVWEDGWLFGAESRGIDQTGLDVTALAIGQAAKVACGTHGFEGDVDEVQVFDRVVSGWEFAANEPTVAATLEIESVTPVTAGGDGSAVVRILPVPARPGRLHIFMTSPDRPEIELYSRPIEEFWSLPPDGRFTIPVVPRHGGTSTLRISYEPQWGMTNAEDTASVVVGPAPSTTRIGASDVNIAGEPLIVSTSVTPDVLVKPTGPMQLREIVDGSPVVIDEAPTVPGDGGWAAGTTFTLPGRAVGTYAFVAHYEGDPDVAAGTSTPVTVTVSPALHVGQVAINDGAPITDDPVVTVSTPATGAIALQIARDPETETGIDPPIPYAASLTTWLTAPSLGDDADGVRTIWVRYADALNRWSDWSADSIVLDRGVQQGTVAINGGAARTGSRDVSVAVPVIEPAQVAAVELSNDGHTWTAMPYAASVPWTLAGAGTRSVFVRWKDLAGRQSAPVTDSIVVDLAAPVVGGIRVIVPLGAMPGSTIGARFSWSATDVSGVSSYDVGIRAGDGAWTPLLTHATATSLNHRVVFGQEYQLRVRATDTLGRRSAWRIGDGLRAASYQDTSRHLQYSGGWSSADGAYWGGSVRYASRAGATATLHVRGSTIAWVASVGPTRGSARVFVDGVRVATIDLHATATRAPRVVFRASWATSRAHVVTIKVVGSGAHDRVDVDGFVVLKAG